MASLASVRQNEASATATAIDRETIKPCMNGSLHIVEDIDVTIRASFHGAGKFSTTKGIAHLRWAQMSACQLASETCLPLLPPSSSLRFRFMPAPVVQASVSSVV
jgi:hypothetical protein